MIFLVSSKVEFDFSGLFPFSIWVTSYSLIFKKTSHRNLKIGKFKFAMANNDSV